MSKPFKNPGTVKTEKPQIDEQKIFDRLEILNHQIQTANSNKNSYLQALEQINSQINQTAGAIEEYHQLLLDAGFDLKTVYEQIKNKKDANSQLQTQ